MYPLLDEEWRHLRYNFSNKGAIMMKSNIKKVLAGVCLAATLFTGAATPTFASSKDVPINAFTITAFEQYITPQRKENATSCYVKLNDVGHYNQAIVNVYGQKDGSVILAHKYNCNNKADNRVIKVSQAYFVTNLVNEKGYPYATLSFKRATDKNYTIQGVWSPDSVPQAGTITI